MFTVRKIEKPGLEALRRLVENRVPPSVEDRISLSRYIAFQETDSREGAELLQLFLAGRGYGASPEAAQDAVGRVEISGCSMPVLQRELESLALVM